MCHSNKRNVTIEGDGNGVSYKQAKYIFFCRESTQPKKEAKNGTRLFIVLCINTIFLVVPNDFEESVPRT